MLIAAGYRRSADLIEPLAGSAPDFVAVGEYVRPRTLLHAVRTGHDTAMSI